MGSTFAIQLPLNESESQAFHLIDKPRHVLRLKPGQEGSRVLVADDVEDNRELLELILRPVGFEVRLAVDAARAGAGFGRWRPHLILMDFRMPVMDGHEAIRRIRAAPGGEAPKIIAVTASALDENRQELLEVEFLYAEDEATGEAVGLTAESLACLPPDLIHQMREAVLGADLDQLLAKIQEAEPLAPVIRVRGSPTVTPGRWREKSVHARF